MKNLLTCLLLLVATMSNAQQYQYVPMPTEDAQWRHSMYGPSPSGKWGFWELLLMVDGSDTTVNNHVYKKVIARICDTALDGNPVTLANLQTKTLIANTADRLWGLMREDSARVYYRWLNGDEQIMYDFNMIVGDTMPVIYMIGSGSQVHVIIDKVDTVYLNGAYRKKFFCGNLTIIEGIGSNRGLFISNTVVRIISDFTCHTYKGWVYSPENRSCSYIWPFGTPTAINETAIENELNVYPNPFSNVLNVRSDKQVITAIYGTAGNKVLQSDQTIISTSHLGSGIYMIVVKDNKGNIVHRQKLIKE